MPKQEDKDQLQPDISINRLGAAIRLPNYGSKNVLYLGWSEGNAPILTWDGAQLSTAARDSLNITHTIKLPGDVSIGDRPIEAVQYLTSLPAIDKPDLPDEYTQDVLVFGVINSKGLTDYIHVEELDLMEGILAGHVVWQDMNSHTMLGDNDAIPTLPMHSLLLPVTKDDGKRVMLAMLFEPTMPNESNEPAFKLFLAQTLKSFLVLDSRQTPDAKKGYERVIADEQSSQSVGGDAYFIMNVLKDIGFEVSKDRLDRIRQQSAGKSFTYQLLLVGRELGLLNFDTPENKAIKGQLDAMKVDDLMNLMEMCYKVVSQTFHRRKR